MEYKIGQLTEIEIVDVPKRIVKGFIGTDRVDAEGHFIPIEVYRKAIVEWLRWGNIRDAHGAAVGNVTVYGTKGWNYIEAVIVDDSVWNKIVNGVYKGFSIGAKVFEKTIVPFSSLTEDMFSEIPEIVHEALVRIGKLLRIDSMMIVEVSVTDRPVNQGAIFIKSMETDNIPVLESVLNMEFTEDKSMGDVNTEVQEDEVESTETVTDEIVSSSGDAVVEDIVAESFDAQKAFGDVQVKLVSLEQTIAVVSQEFTAKLEDVQKSLTDTAKIDAIMAEIQKAFASIEELRQSIVTKVEEVVEHVETEDVVQDTGETVKTASLSAEDIKSIVESSVIKMLETITDGNVTRKNLVNSGGSDDDHVQEQDITKAPLHQQYKDVAAKIGRTIRR